MSSTFPRAVWWFPVAFALHVAEEYPNFTRWAMEHASPLYSQREYDVIHAAGIVAAVVWAFLVNRFPNRWMTSLFFTFALAPSLFFNAFFHSGASWLTCSYCPGVITAVGVYLPLFAWVTRLGLREGLLTPGTIVAGGLLGGIFHAWEVGHNVYKVW